MKTVLEFDDDFIISALELNPIVCPINIEKGSDNKTVFSCVATVVYKELPLCSCIIVLLRKIAHNKSDVSA